MKRRTLMIAIFILSVAADISAGTLSAEGVWSPSGCGEKLPIPGLDQSSHESFNASVGAVNEWQRKSRIYYECLVKEANEDNTAIARMANEEQAQFRETVDKLNAEAADIKKNLGSN